jgi:hypothetical protein
MTTNSNHTTGITIRRLGPADREAVEAIAQRDSEKVPFGDLIGAEVEGRLLAATAIATGATIADPFSRTAEVRDLLELRAQQLTAREAAGQRSGRRMRARATLASSPPGAGGRLLRLPARLT